jgi:hypothetical protein
MAGLELDQDALD